MHVRKAGEKMAILVSGYTLVKAGSALGGKLDPGKLGGGPLGEGNPSLGEITPPVASSIPILTSTQSGGANGAT